MKRGTLWYALIFSLLWAAHAPLLRLPYFWDEAGYYVPAARDLLLTGDPIPTSTLTNAHPPLQMAWLAFCWKLSGVFLPRHTRPLLSGWGGCPPAVTRTAMLLVAAFALLGVFRLARQVSNLSVAAAATLLTALYPPFFAQSSLAHLDMAAAALTLWGLAAYLRRRRWRAAAWFALAGLAKETALLAPIALVIWEVISTKLAATTRTGRAISDQLSAISGRQAALKRQMAGAKAEGTAGQRPAANGQRPAGWKLETRSWQLLLSCLPLAGWLAYHYVRTGAVWGNPEYLRYNLGATLKPGRVLLALGQRVWQLFAYQNMFVLTGAAALALRFPPVRTGGRETGEAACRGAGSLVPPGRAAWGAAGRLPLAPLAQAAFAALMLAYAVVLSVAGGAVLARYLLPVYPLVILPAVAVLWRRVRWWKACVAIVAAAFAMGLFARPLYRSAPEDSLAYADYVRLHQRAAIRLSALPDAGVLTAWPASDELRLPYLGYVAQPLTVVPVENFTPESLREAARRRRGSFDYALVFSTKYEPPRALRIGWWDDLQTRFFDYHRDAPPQTAAHLLGGRLLYYEQRGGEWVAIIGLPELHGVKPMPEQKADNHQDQHPGSGAQAAQRPS